jgi:cytoskeleton protein RodZ
MTKVTQMSFEENGGRRIHLREISGDSEAPLETVGQDLRAARLRRGDDLATVSRSLKIRKDHLVAVEEDNFAELPGKTYAIGFVRSYAGYLGLDAAKTVERYKQEISGRHDDHLPTDSSLHTEDSRRLPYGWRIVAGIVGLALVYGVWHLVSAGPTPQTVPPPPALSPSRPRIAAVAKPTPPPPQPATATGNSAVPTPTTGTEVAPTPAPPKPNSGSLTTGSVAAAPTQGVAKPNSAVPALPKVAVAPSGSGQVYGSLNQNPRVVLRVRGDVRLTVKGDDGKLYLNRDLKAGESYQVPNITGLSLATSDAGAVDVMVDGRDMGKVGQNQEILGRVALDPSSLADRFNSR